MKKIVRCLCAIILLLTTMFSFGCSSGNSDNNEVFLTKEEVIANVKVKLTNKFSNTNIYTNISLPTYYLIEEKYDTYISWESSNNNIINATSGFVNRTLSNQTCTLTATILHKDFEDQISFSLSVPANVYQDSTNSFPKKRELEIKISYIAISSNLKIKIKLANNSKNSEIVYGINSVTFSIYYYSHRYLVKDVKYTNTNKKQFTLESGKCVEIEIPALSKNGLYTNYLLNTNYYCEISDLIYYNYTGGLTHVLYS